MTTASKITLVRVFMIPAFMVTMYLSHGLAGLWMVLSLAIFIIASLTDFIDGYIARHYNQTTNFGKFMDPLADKFMVIGMLVVMCASDMYASVRAVLVWVTLVVILRELAITSLRLLVASSEQKIVVAASWLGKVKTVSQIAAILVMILEPMIWDGGIVSWITVCFMGIMTLWSGIDYLKSYVGFINPNE